MKKYIITLGILFCGLTVYALDNIVKPYTFYPNTKASSSEMNSDFDAVYSGANAAIDELQSAAGNKSSVANRLAASLNADGTLKDYVKASTYANFSTAKASIGGASAVLQVDSGMSCNNLTIGSNIHLFITNSGIINISSGKTLTVNGPYTQYGTITGSGSIIVNSIEGPFYNPQFKGPATGESIIFSGAVESTNPVLKGNVRVPTPVFGNSTTLASSTRFTQDAVANAVAATIPALFTWTTPSFSAGNFTGLSNMTWTVESGDVILDEYYSIGKTMHWIVNLSTTTVGGTLNNALILTLPGGKTCAKSGNVGVYNYMENATYGSGVVYSSQSETKIYLYKAYGASNWAAESNLTNITFNIEFEIQ